MNAEIVAVGSEMLTPERVDTNSLYLTAELNNLGVEVVGKFVVGDHLERLASAVRLAVSRSELVILSGGLGPTEDDLTRDAVAQALDRKLIYHPEIAEALAERFAKLKRKMAEVNKRQAFVIEGADILANDRGTAPGQWLVESGAVVLLLPGPPHELKAMFERQCLPRIARLAPPQVIRTIELRVAGMGESDLDQLIAPVYKKYENPATTILAAAGDIQIHLRARCVTEGEANALLAEVAGPIELLLGDRIYSRNGQPIEAVVGDLLRQNRATVAVAESCTGGLLGERFTSIPGSSDYFVGGFITYSNELKIELLGVTPEILAEHGAVSKEAAEAMAIGARRRANSTYALSITGVAGPEGGSESKPVGTTFIGLASLEGVQVLQRQFIGDRNRIRMFASQMALDLLRRRLTARV
ncbi:MAG TPA: competence/damage-inducible protein A [Bryobacteraceae bacterium]|jgi:nicotinamide-nucleotide amidase|nr:competence/damage-inducible protein A [Bryobacteraceae bacterium]